MGVRLGPAIVVSVLYAFLPSRLIKGEGHLFLDVFYQVPPALLVVLWVCGDDPPVTRDPRRGNLPGLEFRRPRTWIALGICAVSALMSIYYAFFTACLLLAGGAWASITRRTARNAIAGVALAGTIVGCLAVSSLPTLVYQARHGPNPSVNQRTSGEAEVYGMKIAQLLLPVPGHRIPALRRLRQAYDDRAPLSGENGVTSLGFVGGFGFLVLLGLALAKPRATKPGEDRLRTLAALNLVAVLLATIGGFGSLIATLLSPQIRTYSRMNVFIGFFSLVAVAVLLDRLQARRPRAAPFVLSLVLGLGLLDQVSPRVVRPYAATKSAYRVDAALVGSIEAAVPAGTIVFELPYVSFPEQPEPVHRVSSYELLRPYLHARSLRWSFPAMRGRPGDDWAATVSGQTPQAMLEALAFAGVGGVLVNRDGYVDDAATLEAALTIELGVDPILSPDRRKAFFALRNDRPPRAMATPPKLGVRWGKGFFDEEREPGRSFRWVEAEAEMRIINPGRAALPARLRATFAAARPPAQIEVQGDLVSTRLTLTRDGAPFVAEVEVPPGAHTVRFHCDGARADAPEDSRVLIWRAENFIIEEPPVGTAER
jgi:phosphoglycerol transferase